MTRMASRFQPRFVPPPPPPGGMFDMPPPRQDHRASIRREIEDVQAKLRRTPAHSSFRPALERTLIRLAAEYIKEDTFWKGRVQP